MTEKGIKKSTHTASYDAKVATEKMHSDVTTSLEQLEHPGVKPQKASDKKTGAHKVAAHKTGSQLKKK
jgi:hypothetical protein